MQVSNAQEELLEWYSENAKNNHQITHAKERCAAGIIRAIGTFSLGPNVSPRDIRDSLKCTIEICNPCHEVVKFYLFYERWRRGEVERSDHFINHLRLLFVSLIHLFPQILCPLHLLGYTQHKSNLMSPQS